jgi:hypothetical protein
MTISIMLALHIDQINLLPYMLGSVSGITSSKKTAAIWISVAVSI